MILDSNSASGVYDIDNSLKFEADNNEYLSRTPSSAGNRRTWTLSCWVKRTELASSASMQILSAGDTYLHFDGDRLKANFRSAGTNFFFATNRVFRDTSAWYHIVLQCDTTQATNTDRAKLWVNGEAQTADWLDSYDNMALNYETLMNSTDEHEVGKYTNDESTYAEFFNGYMAEMHLVDGTALTPTDFGETDNDSGIWKPKEYTGSYGTNGFYLDFEDSSSLGADSSGNGNNFTPTNIAAADQATDTPTNNFCTLNILDQEFDGTNIVTDGATNVRIAGSGSGCIRGTQAVSSGKWYWEFKVTPINTSTFYGIWGIYTADTSPPGGYPGQSSLTGSWGVYGGNGEAAGSSGFNTFYTDGISSGDIIGLAYDVDGGTLKMYKNGTLVGANSGDIIASSGVSHPAGFTSFLPAFADGTNSPEPSGLLSRFEVNFGGFTNFSISSGNTDENGYGTFEYAPPSGYYAICTKNLAEYG